MDSFSRWPNLAAMMLELGVERGEQPMLRHYRDGAWQVTSWGEFARQAAAVAQGLSAYLARGAPVLLVSESRPEVPIANVALQAIGAIPLPAYVSNRAADHAHLLRDSFASVAIVSTAALAAVVLEGAALAGGLDLLICMETFATDQCPVLHWAELMAGPDALEAVRASAQAIDREAIAVLMYTSGTGGAPRGALLPHRAILANCAGIVPIVAPLHLSGEAYLSILPLSHTYEYTVGQYILPAFGCEVVFGRGVEFLASDMQAVRPRVMTVVPRVLEVIRGRILAEVARAPGWQRMLFARALAAGQRRIDRRVTLVDRLFAGLLDQRIGARVRERFGGRIIALVSGGARLDPEVGRFFLAMGLRVLQGYGQTEAGPVIAVNPIDDIRIATVGPPLPGVEVRIGEDGEILVRGELVMKGYQNRLRKTAQAIEDGWLHTGDIGALRDGYLTITDRKRDIIVLSGGETISPARIETLLMAQAEIAQAVVLGDGKAGLTALIAPAEDVAPAAVAAAVARVNAQLSGAERLRGHQLCAPFTLENGQLTPTHKIRRQGIIAQYRGRDEAPAGA